MEENKKTKINKIIDLIIGIEEHEQLLREFSSYDEFSDISITYPKQLSSISKLIKLRCNAFKSDPYTQRMQRCIETEISDKMFVTIIRLIEENLEALKKYLDEYNNEDPESVDIAKAIINGKL